MLTENLGLLVAEGEAALVVARDWDGVAVAVSVSVAVVAVVAVVEASVEAGLLALARAILC